MRPARLPIAELLALRRAGLKSKEIAALYGVKAGTIRMQFYYAKVDSEAARQWTAGLSVRATNVLRDARLTSEAEVAEALAEDRLQWMPNCGLATTNEIKNWLKAKGLL